MALISKLRRPLVLQRLLRQQWRQARQCRPTPSRQCRLPGRLRRRWRRQRQPNGSWQRPAEPVRRSRRSWLRQTRRWRQRRSSFTDSKRRRTVHERLQVSLEKSHVVKRLTRMRRTAAGLYRSGTSSKQRSRSGASLRSIRRGRPSRLRREATTRAAGTTTGDVVCMARCAAGLADRRALSCTCSPQPPSISELSSSLASILADAGA
mmetsp:Transcript_17018/g.46148  ORF Transcript_17018/g.46148 Transcript_17018/m.46148 type:complete len:207 (-) Transcript_17018:3685-4305(-)